MNTIYFDKNRGIVPKSKAVYYEKFEDGVRIYGDLRTDADREREDNRRKEKLVLSKV